MSKSRFFDKFKNDSCVVERPLLDFTHSISPYPFKSDTMDYLKRFQSGPVNGVDIKICFKDDKRELSITASPSLLADPDRCHQEFRQTIAKISITSFDSEKINRLYENYLRVNNITSEAAVRISKAPGMDMSGSAY